uniref:Outer membrane protein TolC n=1 Tax=Candidatus Kentrum eta TaxID=2126337 RepID=A0A450UEQ8_9GAMM|nr:MAG: Outer membrane protein TolC [Candidatus Kentron sp. H]VFJ90988.1 MAG: Outer membrane protein TolC [Candidatus Kentron sp. H]VFJ97313.1 MAG: Outer membrane protein TolC [Candidatus Kentron sp. H]
MKKFLAFSLSAFLLAGCAVNHAPYTEEEFDELAQGDRNALPEQEPFAREIDLDEAMARAVKYNLKRQVQLMEEELAHNQAILSKFDLLPSLDVESEWSKRDNDQILDSYDVNTQTIESSSRINTQRESTASSAKVVWNILDFGVSYSIAKQVADQEMMAKERRRRAVQEILRDVREAYWRAVGSGMVEEDVDELTEETLKALRLSAKTRRQLLRNPEKVLLYQRSLLEFLARLKEMQAGVVAAKAKLTALMGLTPDVVYTLKRPPQVLPIPSLRLTMEELEQRALRDHPALREAHYQTRFAAEEAQKEIKRMFPGLEFSFGPEYDTNKYLHNQSWLSAGAAVSWNLFNLFSAPRRIETAKQKKELADRQRLELSVALLTRLYVGYAQYELDVEDFQLAACLEDVGAKLNDIKERSVRARASNKLELIRSRVDLLRLQLERTIKYAELQASVALLKESSGMNLLPETLPSHDLDTIRAALREQREQHEENLQYVGRYCGS